MVISEIFLMLFLGLIIAEHNIRYIILGSKDSFFEYIVSLEENAVDFIFAKHKNKFNFDFFMNFLNNFITKYLKNFIC